MYIFGVFIIGPSGNVATTSGS